MKVYYSPIERLARGSPRGGERVVPTEEEESEERKKMGVCPRGAPGLRSAPSHHPRLAHHVKWNKLLTGISEKKQKKSPIGKNPKCKS